ncbi:hypothetical protein Pelo_16776 [Pelomyxa schiedti]|nr:hypothetical protein Pelo_16776 [Pelomyxa schiedti]
MQSLLRLARASVKLQSRWRGKQTRRWVDALGTSIRQVQAYTVEVLHLSEWSSLISAIADVTGISLSVCNRRIFCNSVSASQITHAIISTRCWCFIFNFYRKISQILQGLWRGCLENSFWKTCKQNTQSEQGIIQGTLQNKSYFELQHATCILQGIIVGKLEYLLLHRFSFLSEGLQGVVRFISERSGYATLETQVKATQALFRGALECSTARQIRISACVTQGILRRTNFERTKSEGIILLQSLCASRLSAMEYECCYGEKESGRCKTTATSTDDFGILSRVSNIHAGTPLIKVLRVLTDLEIATSHSYRLRSELGLRNGISQVLTIASNCNRSLPHIEITRKCLKVIENMCCDAECVGLASRCAQLSSFLANIILRHKDKYPDILLSASSSLCLLLKHSPKLKRNLRDSSITKPLLTLHSQMLDKPRVLSQGLLCTQPKNSPDITSLCCHSLTRLLQILGTKT